MVSSFHNPGVMFVLTLCLVANPWDKSREGVETVLSPLRDISKVVNAIADAHPAIKVWLFTPLRLIY